MSETNMVLIWSARFSPTGSPTNEVRR